MKERLSAVETRLAELYTKQNRSKFKSRTERDKYLNGGMQLQLQLPADCNAVCLLKRQALCVVVVIRNQIDAGASEQ